jgi:hypothetical protein
LGIRYNSPDPRWVFSSKPSVLIGYVPSGQNWGNDNLFVAGNVGIGTVVTPYKLTVAGGDIKAYTGDNNSGISIGAESADRARIGFHVSDNNRRFKIEFNGVNQPTERLGFFTNNGGAWPETEVLSIGRTGNVGIGTSAPVTKLHINAQVPGIRLGSSVGAEGFTGEFGAITFTRHYDLNTSAKIYSYANWGTDQYSGGELHFATTPPNSYGAGGLPLTDRMVINSIGNVGIGTAAPNAGLEISKGSTNDLALQLSSSGPGWGSGLRFKNTGASGKTWGVYTGSDGVFHVSNVDASNDVITIMGNNNVGIGTTDPGSFKLAVNGKIWGTEVQVAVTRPPDYVFEPAYDLKPLAEIETYIKENKHLPEVPSAKEMEKNGVQLGEMNMLLLKKVEELTLHLIEMSNRIKNLESENQRLKSDN